MVATMGQEDNYGNRLEWRFSHGLPFGASLDVSSPSDTRRMDSIARGVFDVKWADLEPDPGMLAALDCADGVGDHAAAGFEAYSDCSDQNAKKNWSNRFADACAVMVADELRRHPRLGRFEVRPYSDGSGTEALTFVAAGKTKRVDVIVATLASGLQMGFSLKGLNFPDVGGNYTKNLTGRTYELLDEVGAIHEYQSAAFMVGLYFLPLLATSDKLRAPSSFAKTVAHLRARSGRIDYSLASQLRKCDAAAVALYACGHPDEPVPRGVVRYFDVMNAPPRRGLPRVGTTLDLEGLVARFASQQAMDEADIEYVSSEE